MLLSFDELLKFVLMRSVFCANIAKIDPSGFHVKKRCIFLFEGFSGLKNILNFFFVTTQFQNEFRLDMIIALIISR